ncbi:SPFH domain-containing protein [Acidiluteibacter ferrifornacis]|uniref:SPFH domain-containing protein n=1 Tax=Acidiluteibacter ferrifornacis TaxID=2692424 RepID=A0A6N9NH29_9FLAO|nr:SPFH domain-containing protein [Acidiluteibacter ferrifornacis]NBG65213.1 SPFH domain-containing protein [Acidiluteibacter ferrifornacis]
MKEEKNVKVTNGYVALSVLGVFLLTMILGIALFKNPFFLGLLVVILFIAPGFFTVNPNGSKVLVLFGAYKGTVRENGFHWANPFYSKQRISLRARNFDSERVKVNDKVGNPILINVIAVWRVRDTFKAAFEVDKYEEFVRVQTDAAVRKLAGSYPYDNFDDERAELTLRSGMDEVNDALENEITERLAMAGIEVMEARIGYLAYAPEIASAMLKRQQAVAIVAARKKIVEGAVGMVEDALEQLSRDNIIEFDDDKKASMVSNLMVVLCGDKEVIPVVNTGSLN